ncbi:MAG: GNAT family N-acetyltransferase [Anaerolineae bacterium]|nr:GNAT family N-acetyltransferase [Anaerolineae bacterium]
MNENSITMQIQTIDYKQFSLYDAISNAFEVHTVLQVEVLEKGLGGFRLVETPVPQPYIKDYNVQGNDGPTAWAREFDISRWSIFLAMEDERPVGGVTVVPDASMCPAGPFPRADLAVVWDIRVHPAHRERGIGTMLFRHAVAWAQTQGCGQLALETQNINVPACHFYARQGCTLGAIHRFGYAGSPETAHEVALIWYLDLV